MDAEGAPEASSSGFDDNSAGGAGGIAPHAGAGGDDVIEQ